jgi:flagellar biosynthetic protein FlhB
MAEESFSERTEQATPRKREEARKKGQVAKSREIPSVAILMTGVSVLFLAGTFIYQQLSGLMVRFLNRMESGGLQPEDVQALNVELIRSLLGALSPVLIAVAAVSILSHMTQTGTLFSMEILEPDLSKLNPLKGFKRILSAQSLVELPKAVLKMGIIGVVAWSTISKEGPTILLLAGQEPASIFRTLVSISWSLLLRTGAVMVALAVLDYLFQRRAYDKSLRMTKQEIKEESKLTEGDPLIKSRIRGIQRQLARRRMMAEVPKADVIITNPTHLAVALVYRSSEMAAPRVVAKGAGHLAQKIREIGLSHHIPLIENKPLAQTLYKTVDLGQVIPSTLYQAVADILAYVYRLKNKTL